MLYGGRDLKFTDQLESVKNMKFVMHAFFSIGNMNYVNVKLVGFGKKVTTNFSYLNFNLAPL